MVGATLLFAALVTLGAGCGGGSKGGGGGDATAITNRVNSLVAHFNSGDAKAILDDDVPASARRTCSDKDAKDAVNAARLAFQATGVKLAVKGVDNVQVSGNRATANVTFAGVPGASAGAVPMAFVKDNGGWRVDTGDAPGCAALVPSESR